MWKPDTVVPQHRRRAIVLYGLLLVGMIVYVSWLMYNGVKKRKNPTTSFVLSNRVYRYPDVWVCLYDFYGCDSQPFEEKCIRSIHATEGGKTRARYHPNGANHQELKIAPVLTDKRGWCAVVEASAVEVELGKEREPDNYLDYILLDMYWYPGGYPGNSTTCGMEDGEWKDHSESVFVFLNDTATGIVSTGIQVSYSCITSQSSSHFFNYVGMGVTEEVRLDKTTKAQYKALSTSSAVYKDKRTADITGIKAPYAYLAINIAQEPDSWETVTEVNPLEIAEVFGNVGGFWDLLTIFWPIFFVVTTRQEPFLKPRNFKRSVTKVAGSAMSVTRRRPPASRTTASETDEERPSWDKSAASFRETTQGEGEGEGEGEVLIRLFDHHGLVAVINGACVKKFLKSRFNAKCLKIGALEPSLQQLLPPHTYVILVPRGSTAESVAKEVAARCNTGGDVVESFDDKPIPVKAKRPRLSTLQSHTLSTANYISDISDIAGESDVDLGEAGIHHPAISRNDTEPITYQMLFRGNPRSATANTPIRSLPA